MLVLHQFETGHGNTSDNPSRRHPPFRKVISEKVVSLDQRQGIIFIRHFQPIVLPAVEPLLYIGLPGPVTHRFITLFPFDIYGRSFAIKHVHLFVYQTGKQAVAFYVLFYLLAQAVVCTPGTHVIPTYIEPLHIRLSPDDIVRVEVGSIRHRQGHPGLERDDVVFIQVTAHVTHQLYFTVVCQSHVIRFSLKLSCGKPM